MRIDVIQADYVQLESIGARFQQQAETVNEITQRIVGASSALRDGGWQGEGVAAFAQEMDEVVLPVLQRLTQSLSESHHVTLLVSETIRNAEIEAAGLFQVQGAIDALGNGGSESSSASISGSSPAAAPSVEQALERGRNRVGQVFQEEYMQRMIGRVERGANSSELNSAMEELLDKVRKGERDMTTVGPVLDRIAQLRGVDSAGLREQYQNVFLPLWDNSPAKGSIDLARHGDYMGSTISLRYGRVVGDVFGMDPVLGAVLNPTGGLVGPGDSSYQPSTNDAIGYHGIFHDAGGYLYNYQNGIGPGYDYLDREPFSKGNPLTGQVGGISWWASQPQLDVDVLPHLMPDIPYVPRFVEQAMANAIEDAPISVIRQGIFVVEGGINVASGVADLIQGNWSDSGLNITEGSGQIAHGMIRRIWDMF